MRVDLAVLCEPRVEWQRCRVALHAASVAAHSVALQSLFFATVANAFGPWLWSAPLAEEHRMRLQDPYPSVRTTARLCESFGDTGLKGACSVTSAIAMRA